MRAGPLQLVTFKGPHSNDVETLHYARGCASLTVRASSIRRNPPHPTRPDRGRFVHAAGRIGQVGSRGRGAARRGVPPYKREAASSIVWTGRTTKAAGWPRLVSLTKEKKTQRVQNRSSLVGEWQAAVEQLGWAHQLAVWAPTTSAPSGDAASGGNATGPQDAGHWIVDAALHQRRRISVSVAQAPTPMTGPVAGRGAALRQAACGRDPTQGMAPMRHRRRGGCPHGSPRPIFLCRRPC